MEGGLNMSLIGKYVISPLDNRQYCRKNGQFLRHLRKNGFASYQEFFDGVFPTHIKVCPCGNKCSFDQHKMEYLRSCGNRSCVGKVTSRVKRNFTEEQWKTQVIKYRQTMSLKSKEERDALIQSRLETGHQRGSYKKSVPKREQTCQTKYKNKKYNNSKQISQTKLEWSENRKQLFLEKLKESLDGKWLNDFHTEEMYVARRKMLEERGDIIPLEDLTEWKKYSRQVRNLTEKTYRKNKNIINPNNLPRTLGEYELDHIIPVAYGFKNEIPPALISSIENLQMLSMKQNRRKWAHYDQSTRT